MTGEPGAARSMNASSGPHSGTVMMRMMAARTSSRKSTRLHNRTSTPPNRIREGNTVQLTTLIQNGKAEGMQTMDDALMGMIESGRITPHDAYMKAKDKQRFEPLLPADA